MSKWIKKELFKKFQEEKKQEKDTQSSFIRSNLVFISKILKNYYCFYVLFTMLKIGGYI